MIIKLYSLYKKARLNKIKNKLGRIGENVVLEYGDFNHPENMYFGNNIYVGPGASFAADDNLIVEDGVIIGPKCVIYTSSHNYDSEDLYAIPYDGTTIISPVVIKKNTWVGGQTLILPGVEIGEGCVIAAGSVVTKNVEDFAVVGGNPAKILKYRDKDRYRKLLQSNNIYLKMKLNNNIKYKKVKK